MLKTQRSDTRPVVFAAVQGSDFSADQSRRMRSALLDSISRDVARPLALISGAAASLKNRNELPEVRGELIDVIETEVERVGRFVSILLDMAKLECGSIIPQAEEVFAKDLIGVAVKDAAWVLQDRTTEIHVSAGLLPLRLDSAILRRVLFLLIENAARQSPPGSTIGIHAGRDRSAVRIQVLDEGDGIPPQALAGLFDQVHLPCTDDRSRSGAGMHLAVCRGYVEAMGGTISGSNRTDRRGAVFTITFPLVA